MDFGIPFNPLNSLKKTKDSCTKFGKKFFLTSPIKNGYADFDAKITIILAPSNALCSCWSWQDKISGIGSQTL